MAKLASALLEPLALPVPNQADEGGLEQGESPTAVMNRYQVVIVAHGEPETEEIEIFRDQIVHRLGYCPQNMA